MLYRAASRTFHSTRILRHLFLIHTTLAEFGLAHRALDSYVELVTRGKARIEKSGNPEIGVDNDATSLETAALGIQMLCEYGGRKEAERAQEIAETINKWLQKIENPENKTDANAEDVPKDLQEQQRMAGGSVLREALAAAYRGIGISHTYWAGLTYDTNSRPEWQSKAISSFRSAISFSARDRHGAQGHFLLAFILAKTRDLGAAIASVKQAISICNEILEDLDEDEDVSDPAALQDRRLLFKCWHLLAFLLSARQDFSTATASCDAASETYEGFSNPSEDTQLQGLRKILDIDERENLVELKMTQLALLEIVESPEDAVNVSGELLGVYANLFGEKSVQTSQRPPSNVGTAAEPRPLPAANGSVRSFRNSLLSWSKEPSSKRIAPSSKEDKSKDLEDSLNTQAASKPIISISLDGEAPRFNKYQPPQHLARQESKKLQKRNSRKSIDSAAGSVRRVRDRSKTRGSGSHFSDQSGQALPLRVAQIRGSSLDDSDSRPSSGSDDYSSDEVGVAVSHNMPPQSRPSTSKSVPQKIHASQPLASQVTQRKSASQAPEPPKSPQPGPIRQTSSSLQVTLPTPLFSLKEQKRHAQTLLAKIWLFIASLYRHAGMPADAQGAITEALAAVQTIENAVMAATPSEEALSKPGWGSVKSVSELWADALAEQATLYLEQGKRTDASATFEKALLWYPDHGGAIVGLSNMLLDVYEQPQERERDQERVGEGRADDEALLPPKPKPVLDALLDLDAKDASAEVQEAEALDKEERSRPSPLLLSRLAARDRAYGLLSMLTKSGRGWDDSEAWFALARSHEQSGLVDKAKEALWWVVELEEGRPVRHWSHLGRY